MVTSPEDRIAALKGWQNFSKPTPPVAGAKTFAEKELESQIARQNAWHQPEPEETAKASIVKAPIQQSALAATAQESAVTEPTEDTATPAPTEAFEVAPTASTIYNTDDDGSDEYLASLRKPAVTKPAKTSKKPQSNRNGKNTKPNAEDLNTYEAVRKDLPTSDDAGNSVTGHFCVLDAASKFPYKFMNDTDGRVSREFFAAGKFYHRGWDVYYLRAPASSSVSPLLLLPFKQFKQFTNEISKICQADVTVPSYPFTITFFKDGTPLPHLLGTFHDKETITEQLNKVPVAAIDYGETPQGVSPSVKAAFAKFQAIFEKVAAAKKKTKTGATKTGKKKPRSGSVQIRYWCTSLARAQRYLGLLPPKPKLSGANPNLTWEEEVEFMKTQGRQSDVQTGTLDLMTPAPFEFEKSPVFVCVDIEAYERDSSVITEVGISILDTLDLINIAPGVHAENWRKHIRSQHFRIDEYSHIRNRDFCPGDPASFAFGTSEFVLLKDIGERIDRCFEYPFAVQFEHDGRAKTWAELEGPQSQVNTKSSKVQKGPKDRNILLVGHNLKADLDYLAQLGSSIFSDQIPATTLGVGELQISDTTNKLARGIKGLKSIREAMDTQILYQKLMEAEQGTGVSKMLHGLDIDAFALHNAGNDARFSLEALVALTLRARLSEKPGQGNAEKDDGMGGPDEY